MCRPPFCNFCGETKVRKPDFKPESSGECYTTLGIAAVSFCCEHASAKDTSGKPGREQLPIEEQSYYRGNAQKSTNN